jgi:hypothetical protein
LALSNAWQGQQPALLLLLLCAAACLPQQNDGGGGGSVPSLAAASMALTLLSVSRILLGLLLAYLAQTAAQLATLCCLSLMLPAAYAQEVTVLGDGTIVCGASEGKPIYSNQSSVGLVVWWMGGGACWYFGLDTAYIHWVGPTRQVLHAHSGCDSLCRL